MAKVLGIDYGTKRVGIAMSDTTASVAFPRVVLVNDGALLATITELCKKEQPTLCVIGRSRDFAGRDNKISRDVASFIEQFKQHTEIPVQVEDEFLTSAEARKVEDDPALRDAHAAAFILQRYLDRQNHE